MDDRGGSFVAVRRISQGLERGNNTCHSSSAEVVAGSAAWLGRGLSCVCAQRRESDARPSFDLTPPQEECLQRLQSRIDVAYDSSVPEHQVFHSHDSLTFQCNIPHIAYDSLVPGHRYPFFRRSIDDLHMSFQDLLQKREGERSVWEYPFAVAGVNITFMLIQMLDLEAVKPRTLVGATFLKFLAEDDSAFDLLYCITFKLMDHEWLNMHASYMDFNAVMKSTRRQLERELLSEDITRLEELPSYTLLTR
ncbi:ELMO/CED-12 FAMILY PROTEIN-RELATED [Salix koriyanagi]|uniref:ELMO/CED-12 FAMILY PROTEIN-RELATED n=1 Tax=Salix koriyanagi TaxID=2511006 RepID=A0A9Q0Z605_9ROSI|nr:ELMO/CED-12 FAMILY PROTEIN-RELATED [Salix koriyanagi]